MELIYYSIVLVVFLAGWCLMMGDQKRLKGGIFCPACDMPLEREGDLAYCSQCDIFYRGRSGGEMNEPISDKEEALEQLKERS